LDLDERTRIYTDIGDKKATDKTSQALREGQIKIRQDIYQNKDTSMPMLPPPPTNADGKLEISGEGYFGFSVQVLETLYNAENNMTPEMAARPAPHSVATQLGLQQNRDGPVYHPAPSPGVSQAHMAAVLDQFDGMVPVQQQQQQQQHQQQATTHPTMPPPDPRVPDPRPTLSSSSSSPIRDTMRDTMLSRLTGLSLMSEFSGRNLTELIEAYDRGTVDDSNLAAEIRELVRRSESELANIHIQDMNMDDFGGRESAYDLRFTDLSKERFSRFSDVEGGTARIVSGETASARTTESSDDALMQRDTMLTIPPSEYSPSIARTGQQRQQSAAMPSNDRSSVMSVDIAEALLRLSRDSKEKLDSDDMQMD